MTTSKYSLDVPVAIIGTDGFATTAGWLTTYNCNVQTREYTGARQDYLQVGITPAAGAYLDAPTLPTEQDKAVCRTEDGKAWEIVSDYRGRIAYDTASGQSQPITDMGELPSTLTLLAPLTPYDKWDGKQWVTDKDAQHAADVAKARETLARLSAEADAAIAPLARAVKLNMATDAEKSTLEAWERYSVELSRINPEDAPNIDWLVKPE